MEKIAVVGAGMMGQGIAEVFAARGHSVALHDSKKEVLAQAHEKARANFKVFGVDESAAENISLYNSMEEGLRGADIVFEMRLRES